jgi:hypothetical protein
MTMPPKTRITMSPIGAMRRLAIASLSIDPTGTGRAVAVGAGAFGVDGDREAGSAEATGSVAGPSVGSVGPGVELGPAVGVTGEAAGGNGGAVTPGGRGVGTGVGTMLDGIGVDRGVAVGFGVTRGVGAAVGDGVGGAVGTGVGTGVGSGLGVGGGTTVTFPLVQLAEQAQTEWAPGLADPGMAKERIARPVVSAVTVPSEDPAALSQWKSTGPGGKPDAVTFTMAPGTPFDGETTTLWTAKTGEARTAAMTRAGTSAMPERARRTRAIAALPANPRDLTFPDTPSSLARAAYPASSGARIVLPVRSRSPHRRAPVRFSRG